MLNTDLEMTDALSETNVVKYGARDHIAVMTLNGPEQRSAFDSEKDMDE